MQDGVLGLFPLRWRVNGWWETICTSLSACALCVVLVRSKKTSKETTIIIIIKVSFNKSNAILRSRVLGVIFTRSWFQVRFFSSSDLSSLPHHRLFSFQFSWRIFQLTDTCTVAQYSVSLCLNSKILLKELDAISTFSTSFVLCRRLLSNSNNGTFCVREIVAYIVWIPNEVCWLERAKLYKRNAKLVLVLFDRIYRVFRWFTIFFSSFSSGPWLQFFNLLFGYSQFLSILFVFTSHFSHFFFFLLFSPIFLLDLDPFSYSLTFHWFFLAIFLFLILCLRRTSTVNQQFSECKPEKKNTKTSDTQTLKISFISLIMSFQWGIVPFPCRSLTSLDRTLRTFIGAFRCQLNRGIQNANGIISPLIASFAESDFYICALMQHDFQAEMAKWELSDSICISPILGAL